MGQNLQVKFLHILNYNRKIKSLMFLPDERDVPVAKIGINEDAEVVVVVLVPRLNCGVVAELAAKKGNND